jgi:hypothetical protein
LELAWLSLDGENQMGAQIINGCWVNENYAGKHTSAVVTDLSV